MTVTLLSLLQPILGLAGNVADGLAIAEWLAGLRRLDRPKLYANAFEEVFKLQAPHIPALAAQSQPPSFDRAAFEKEVRSRGLLADDLPVIANQFDEGTLKTLTDILRNGLPIPGVDIGVQHARNVIRAAHRRYQARLLSRSPAEALQSQLAKFEELSDQQFHEVMETFKRLEILTMRQPSAELPVPRILLPDIPPWMVPLRLKPVGSPAQDSTTYTIQELLSSSIAKFCLIGKSGGGKTSTLQGVTHYFFTGPAEPRYCAWIPLRSYAHSLIRTIKNSIGWSEAPDERVLIELERRAAVLLLDGLNEVPEGGRDQCAAEIDQLIRSYRGSIIISYPDTDQSFYAFECPGYEILPLEETQIHQIVQEYFAEAEQPRRIESFLARINDEMQDQGHGFYALAATPLHLQFLCELGQEKDFDFQTDLELYRQVIDKKLEWVGQRGKAGQIPKQTKVQILAELAYRSIIEDRSLRLSEAYVIEAAARILPAVDAAVACDEIARSGLLSRLSGYLEWSHPSFRDYLAGYRLQILVEANTPPDNFPFNQPRASLAVAYAVGLSTSGAAEFTKRPVVFSMLLQAHPGVEAVRIAVTEYRLSNYIGDGQTWAEAKTEFGNLQWGERFLKAYRQLEEIARAAQLCSAGQLPRAEGLVVLLSATGDFCTVLYSIARGVRFGNISSFDQVAAKLIRQQPACQGFCLHGRLLPTVDPEVMAYIQVGVWLRLADVKTDAISSWHRDIANFTAITPSAWASWATADRGSEPSARIRAAVTLSWEEIYTPVTFQVDPQATPASASYVSNRLSQISHVVRPPTQISLALLMPFSLRMLQVDLDTQVFVPFPIHLLQRQYFVQSVEMNFDRANRATYGYAHLRG